MRKIIKPRLLGTTYTKPKPRRHELCNSYNVIRLAKCGVASSKSIEISMSDCSLKTEYNDRLLNKTEIADFLNVSVKMIDRKVSMNEIPFVKVGKLVRFSKERVLAWAEESIPKR